MEAWMWKGRFRKATRMSPRMSRLEIYNYYSHKTFGGSTNFELKFKLISSFKYLLAVPTELAQISDRANWCTFRYHQYMYKLRTFK